MLIATRGSRRVKKRELLKSLESKTAPQAQSETAKAFLELELAKRDIFKALGNAWTLTVTLTHEENTQLDRARELLSHAEREAS